MGLFDSQEERARKKRLKEEEKERKRKEYERIMASNPEVTVSTKPKVTTKTGHKIKTEKELEYERKAELLLRNQYLGSKDTNVARCPKCGSTSITGNKKGFSLAKGALGVATVGAYGVVAAGHGKNKVLVTCLNCGKQWKPGK
jgi:DNA-directed RNA polymerase subunit M/transcription elongation factor TFIIS